MAEMTEDSKSDTARKQLVELVDLNLTSNAALNAEIDLFDRYISRLDLRTFETVWKWQNLSTEKIPGRKAKVRTPGRQQLLTLEQKCVVAKSVYKKMIEDLKIAKIHSEKQLDNYKATLEEADIHLAEIKKERSHFKRNIVEELEDKKSMTMSAEKVMRYIEDKIKAKDILIEKLHRKNSALLTHKKKQQAQLRQQEEMAEGVTVLDFELLKFENIRFRKQLDEQNLKQVNLKLLAVKTLQTLNSNKEKLHILTNESEMLSSDTALRTKLLVKIEEETEQAEEERHKAEALNRKLRDQLADFHVPHVLQYIKLKESHGQLQKSVREWERKVEIAEMALKTYTKSWDKLRFAAGAGLVPI
ncbi:cilia- and flagella-associated protein 263 [Danio rerio]|uniref:Cilia- and flagella-associated protein 263 n=1 Tax=Danio rerio TaxID=7955 RepID=CF263_DANRE|nr:coiled-coil domain-containing protein 113 [Danio rerio]Q5XJN6.1 RecName: Full=Coiled-coil domain-containing protein 113 [Danio rerio]AAH83263.1 Zgc:101745 [Danio rerio]|eukprot:NP_001006061.1 coiled-coil domain-containing protein 113 [Danio rerio]